MWEKLLPLLKTGSDKIIYWLGRYSFLLDIFKSKKWKGLWFYILIESSVLNLLHFFYRRKEYLPSQSHWSNMILIPRLNLALFLYNKKVEICKTEFKYGKNDKIQWNFFQKISNFKIFPYIDFFSHVWLTIRLTSRDEFKLEFSSSSEPELWRFRAEAL